MKRGISFLLPNEYGSFLGELLKPIDITPFSWRIVDHESYFVVKDRLDEDLFPRNGKVMDGSEFKNLVENNIYYIIYAELQAYPNGNFSDIGSYEDFYSSECELVLFLFDSSFVEIYCKKEDYIAMLYKNAKKCGYKDVHYITDKNDLRTSFSV